MKNSKVIQSVIEKIGLIYTIKTVLVGGSYANLLRNGVPQDKYSDIDLVIVVEDEDIRVHGNEYVDDIKVDYFIYSKAVLMTDLLVDARKYNRALCHLVSNSIKVHGDVESYNYLVGISTGALNATQERQNGAYVLEYSKIKNNLDDYNDLYEKGFNCIFVGQELVGRIIDYSFFLSGKRKPHRKHMGHELMILDPVLHSMVLSVVEKKYAHSEVNEICQYFFNYHEMNFIENWRVTWVGNSGLIKIASIELDNKCIYSLGVDN